MFQNKTPLVDHKTWHTFCLCPCLFRALILFFFVSLISVIHILRSQYSIGPRITMVRAQRTDHTLRVIFSTKNYSSNVSCTCCSGAELALEPRGTASYQQLFNGPRSKCHGEVSDHKSCRGDPPQKTKWSLNPYRLQMTLLTLE